MRTLKHSVEFVISSLLLAFACVSAAFAQTPCTGTFNVGDTIVFSWTAPVGGSTPSGYNLVFAPTLAGLVTEAATNVAGPDFFSVGSTLTFTVTASAAMAGTTFFAAVNDYTCPVSGTCTVSPLSPTCSITVNAQGNLAPTSLTITKGPAT